MTFGVCGTNCGDVNADFIMVAKEFDFLCRPAAGSFDPCFTCSTCD